MMRSRLIELAHFAVLGLESMALVGLLAWMLLLAVQPTGWTSTGEGDVLRFRFQPGQDELIARCVCVQVAFETKEYPRAFENPKLTVRKSLDADNPYGWIEVSAPPGSRSFRLDFHPVKGYDKLVTGPEVLEMYLGNQRLSWSAIKANYQFDKTWHVPCYWYRPEYFLNLSARQIGSMALVYLSVFFAMAIAIVFKREGAGL